MDRSTFKSICSTTGTRVQAHVRTTNELNIISSNKEKLEGEYEYIFSAYAIPSTSYFIRGMFGNAGSLHPRELKVDGCWLRKWKK